MDDDREEGPVITKSKVIYAIKSQKNRKATGSDGVHATITNLKGKGLELIARSIQYHLQYWQKPYRLVYFRDHTKKDKLFAMR